MSITVNFSEYDIIFLSYDEPNADENWQQVLNIFPDAKRVHGVKGSDSAHKAAAQNSTTDRFVVIDGDNFITKNNFKNQIIEIFEDIDITQSVFSWPSYNTINGLTYGNGGIKCWPKDLALSMLTHENAPTNNQKSQVDFCWDINYIPLDYSFSEIRNNATPHQAWRAGFREGVKMSLDQGRKAKSINDLWHGNIKRLLIWMTVGSDITNGIWSILGARMGCYMTLCTDWDFVQVRDFDYLNMLWKTNLKNFSEKDLKKEIKSYGRHLNKLIYMPEMFNPAQSIFFKNFDFNPPRQSSTVHITFES